MNRWYEKAIEQLEDELEKGLISNEDFRAQMRDLNAEMQQEAEDAAQSAYDETMGYY